MTFPGFCTPAHVRELMEQADIYLVTSDRKEGWGAVVNEAMNSGCVPVGNVQAGAVPYLLKHKENGMIYPADCFDKMEEAVRYLLANPEERKRMGLAAYQTITEQWNAKEAAKRLLAMIEGWQRGTDVKFAEGPLSLAPVIFPRKMFQYMMKNAKRR